MISLINLSFTYHRTISASGVPVTFVSAGSSNSDGWDGFLDMVNYLLALPTIPHVLTTSYAFNEPGLSASAANTLCNAYMQLGARGTSIVSAHSCAIRSNSDEIINSSLRPVME